MLVAAITFASIATLCGIHVCDINDPNHRSQDRRAGSYALVADSNARRQRNLEGRIGKLISRIYVTKLFGKPSATAFGDFCGAMEMKSTYLDASSILDAVNRYRTKPGDKRICAPTGVIFEENKMIVLVHKSVDPADVVQMITEFANNISFIENLKVHDVSETGYKDIRSIDLFDLIEARNENAYNIMANALKKYHFAHSEASTDNFNKLYFKFSQN